MTNDPSEAHAAMPGAQTEFPCQQCGAKLEFAPGTTSLKCRYCGHENVIQTTKQAVRELDFLREIQKTGLERVGQEQLTIKCTACAAETVLQPNVSADKCPFCGSPIVAQAATRKLIQPGSLLPFHVTRQQACELFKKWIVGLWFAPSALKHYARTDASAMQGLYMPAWTYDCRTTTHYTGERGDAYYVTESYTDSQGRRQTRTVRKIRWSYASGTVHNTFDDVLVLASQSLPIKQAQKLEPWDLKRLVPYDDQYLAGFKAETYQVDLVQGFEIAKGIMAGPIQATIRRDIGGDEQRIHSMNVEYYDITYKHILLPVWVSAYRFRERVFRFLVNARTGEVQGERPWSWIKITLFVLLLLIVAVTVYYFANGQKLG